MIFHVLSFDPFVMVFGTLKVDTICDGEKKRIFDFLSFSYFLEAICLGMLEKHAISVK